jgi:multiple antibiotic resistance protein
MVGEILSLSLVSLSALFFVVDPIAAVPFFLAMTRKDGVERRRETALRAAVTTGLVLSTFALAGAWVFRILGISLGAFKIAGGVVLLLLALDMIRTKPSRTRITEGEVEAGADQEDVAIVPLAMPLLAGPGSIATAIVLM